MSGFKDAVRDDIGSVFLNAGEFAERRSVAYDGEVYHLIPVVLNGIKLSKRQQLANDHAQGLYSVTDILHCARKDLGGKLPERGAILELSDVDDESFFRRFYVAKAQDTVGMLRIELEAIDQ